MEDCNHLRVMGTKLRRPQTSLQQHFNNEKIRQKVAQQDSVREEATLSQGHQATQCTIGETMTLSHANNNCSRSIDQNSTSLYRAASKSSGLSTLKPKKLVPSSSTKKLSKKVKEKMTRNNWVGLPPFLDQYIASSNDGGLTSILNPKLNSKSQLNLYRADSRRELEDFHRIQSSSQLRFGELGAKQKQGGKLTLLQDFCSQSSTALLQKPDTVEARGDQAQTIVTNASYPVVQSQEDAGSFRVQSSIAPCGSTSDIRGGYQEEESLTLPLSQYNNSQIKPLHYHPDSSHRIPVKPGTAAGGRACRTNKAIEQPASQYSTFDRPQVKIGRTVSKQRLSSRILDDEPSSSKQMSKGLNLFDTQQKREPTTADRDFLTINFQSQSEDSLLQQRASRGLKSKVNTDEELSSMNGSSRKGERPRFNPLLVIKPIKSSIDPLISSNQKSPKKPSYLKKPSSYGKAGAHKNNFKYIRSFIKQSAISEVKANSDLQLLKDYEAKIKKILYYGPHTNQDIPIPFQREILSKCELIRKEFDETVAQGKVLCINEDEQEQKIEERRSEILAKIKNLWITTRNFGVLKMQLVKGNFAKEKERRDQLYRQTSRVKRENQAKVEATSHYTRLKGVNNSHHLLRTIVMRHGLLKQLKDAQLEASNCKELELSNLYAELGHSHVSGLYIQDVDRQIQLKENAEKMKTIREESSHLNNPAFVIDSIDPSDDAITSANFRRNRPLFKEARGKFSSLYKEIKKEKTFDAFTQLYNGVSKKQTTTMASIPKYFEDDQFPLAKSVNNWVKLEVNTNLCKGPQAAAIKKQEAVRAYSQSAACLKSKPAKKEPWTKLTGRSNRSIQVKDANERKSKEPDLSRSFHSKELSDQLLKFARSRMTEGQF